VVTAVNTTAIRKVTCGELLTKQVMRKNVIVYKKYVYTSESKKLSALLFFQLIYTKVGVEQVRHFSI
jgi:hypothetical protein